VACAALLVAPAAARAAAPSAHYSQQVVVSGLTTPTAVAFLPDGRMLVTEKGGALKLAQGGAATTLADIPVCTGGEMGLLGIAPDPAFATNGFVYLFRSAPGSGGCGTATGRFNQVVRVTMAGNTVVDGSLTVLLSGIRTDTTNHDGGTVRVGPDGKLWVSTGDAGTGDGGAPGESTNPYSQDLAALEGKILRLELDGSAAAGNPFIGQPPARPEVYARGFRNPFRMSFDDQTGRLWVGDVGQAAREEIDVVQAGGNYAWPRCEGTLPAGCEEPGDVPPVFEYPHSGTGALGRTVTGGAFLAADFGVAGGRYVFGDYIANKLYVAVPNPARTDIAPPVELVTDAAGPVDIVTGPDHALYWVAIRTGEIRRLATDYPRPAGAAQVRVPLVPAFQECTAPDRAHGTPLAFGACAPPALRSGQLTVGEPDVNGAPAKSTGRVRLQVRAGDPATPADEADVDLRVSITDVRNLAGLTDYTGELQAYVSLRVTDKNNPAPSGSPAGTVSDGQLAWTVPCTATSDVTVGSTCALNTSVDSLVPGAVVEGVRAVWQLGKVAVFDGGPDGVAATTPNNRFAVQGVFVP
jgi:glucose/arabinose dehydrogenase